MEEQMASQSGQRLPSKSRNPPAAAAGAAVLLRAAAPVGGGGGGGAVRRAQVAAVAQRRGVAKVTGRRLAGKKSKTAGTGGLLDLVSTAPGAKPVTMWAVLASRRLARRWLTIVRQRRSADRNHRRQPTYQLEPSKRFHPGTVHLVVKSVTNRRMDNYRYNVKSAALMAKLVAMEVKEAVKEMNYDRYKIVCMVTVGQKNEQGLLLGSRCSCNATQDSSTTYVFENNSVFCSVSVYGMYRE